MTPEWYSNLVSKTKIPFRNKLPNPRNKISSTEAIWTENCHKAKKRRLIQLVRLHIRSHSQQKMCQLFRLMYKQSWLIIDLEKHSLRARSNGHLRGVSDARAINQRQLRPADNDGSPQNAKTYQILKFIWSDQPYRLRVTNQQSFTIYAYAMCIGWA